MGNRGFFFSGLTFLAFFVVGERRPRVRLLAGAIAIRSLFDQIVFDLRALLIRGLLVMLFILTGGETVGPWKRISTPSSRLVLQLVVVDRCSAPEE